MARKSTTTPPHPAADAEAVCELARCALSAVYFVDTYCRIFEPRSDAGGGEGTIPFRLFDYQREMLEKLQRLDGNLLIEKSRQMGLSWLLMAFQLWAVLFRPGFSALCVSRKEEEVDDRTTRSLFGKLRFMYERLPEFLRPVEVESTKLRFAVPENDSFVKGESSNSDASRGGTFTFLLLDEAAHIDNAETMWMALRQSAQTIVLNSTPNGKGNLFARIRFAEDSGFEKMRVHWSAHPHRDAAWFERQTRDMTEAEIAQELEISYDRSKKDRVYREFAYERHVSDAVRFNPDLPLYTAQDFGIRDPWAILWIQTDPADNVYVIDEYVNNGEIVDHYAAVLLDGFARYARPAANYGDPAGNQQNPVSGSSIIREFRTRWGIRVETARSTIIDGITAVKRALGQGRLFVAPRCTHLIECFQNYRYAPSSGGEADERPLHDWTSHAMDALRYFFVNRYPVISITWRQSSVS